MPSLTRRPRSNAASHIGDPENFWRHIDAPGFDRERPWHPKRMTDGTWIRVNDDEKVLTAARQCQDVMRSARDAAEQRDGVFHPEHAPPKERSKLQRAQARFRVASLRAQSRVVRVW